MDSVDFMPEQY